MHKEEIDVEVLKVRGRKPRYDTWTLKLKCSCPKREGSEEEFRMSFLKSKNFIEDGDLTDKGLKKIRKRYLEIVEEDPDKTVAFGKKSSKEKSKIDDLEGSNYNVSGAIKLQKSSTDRSLRDGEDEIVKKCKERIRKRKNKDRDASLEPFEP